MRQVQEPQLTLGSVGIEEIRLDPKSRDDIPAILLDLQHLYADVDLRARLFALLEEQLCPGVDLTVGRPGLELLSSTFAKHLLLQDMVTAHPYLEAG